MIIEKRLITTSVPILISNTAQQKDRIEDKRGYIVDIKRKRKQSQSDDLGPDG
jgi:hypothetical protein